MIEKQYYEEIPKTKTIENLVNSMNNTFTTELIDNY